MTTPQTTAASGGAVAPNADRGEPIEQKPSERYRVKVDGEEREVDLDELRRGYEHASAANARMRQAADIQKRLQTWAQRGGAGDLGWLTDEFGIPSEKAIAWAEKTLLQHYEYQDLPEDRRNFLEEKRRREKLERELEAIKKTDQEQRQAAIDHQAAAEIDDEIGEALKAYGGKKSLRLARRLAEEMLASLQAKQERLPAAKALERARKSVHEDAIEFLSVASEQEIRALPKETLARIRKMFVDDAKAQAPARFQASRDEAPRPRQSRRLSTDEAFDRIGKKLGG